MNFFHSKYHSLALNSHIIHTKIYDQSFRKVYILLQCCILSVSPPTSQISEPDQELTVTHMFYTAWPDHGVPHNTMSLISFIRRVRKEHPTSLTTPLLVHCSAGVGRTGTFILLDLAMQQMRSQGTLSVFQHLKNMRTQRMKMVQTLVSGIFSC